MTYMVMLMQSLRHVWGVVLQYLSYALEIDLFMGAEVSVQFFIPQ